MGNIFSLAIDGPAGAGKSTIARAVAERMGALYLDTGAMYRAVGLWMLRHGVDPGDGEAVGRRVGDVRIDVKHVDGCQRVFLADEDVSEAIRTPEASMAASAVSAHPPVRARMVAMQREIARGKSVVMDGRDIGTKVLPDATLKIFLVADPKKRAERRLKELREKGFSDTPEAVYQAILKRDHDDSTRAASPLCRAEDAVVVDTGEMTREEAIEAVQTLLREALAR